MIFGRSHAHNENHPLLRGLVGFAALGISIWCLIAAKEFFIPVLFAALLAMLMAPGVRLLKKYNVPEGLAVTFTTILLYAPLLGLASLVLIEAQSIVQHWPEIYSSAKAYFEQMMETPYIAKLHIEDYVSISDIQSKFSERAGEGALLFFTGITTILSAGTTTVLVLTFAAIMLASRIHLRKSFEAIFAGGAVGEGEGSRTLEGALKIIEQFLVARVLIIVFVAVADFIILKCFGVPYSITLSALLGVSTLIPIVGFFIGIVPPIIVAASQGHGFGFLIGLTAALGLVSSAQDHVLTPALIGRKLNLNFLATYLAIFAGEQMWGLWGMFLSIPLLGVLRVLLTASDDLRPWATLLEEVNDPKSAVKKGGLAEELKP